MSCRGPFLVLFAGLVLGCQPKPAAEQPSATETDNGLRTVVSFASVADPSARSAALFTEATRVFLHPRCQNCHPSDGRPRQLDASIVHVPPVWGGVDGRGEPALLCTSCHQTSNYEALAMPGAPDWHLAPPEMVFIGQSPAAICAGLKDNQRNGGKTLDEVVHHVRHDGLVAWGYAPGPTRTKPPGSQETLAALIAEWARLGAFCPTEDR